MLNAWFGSRSGRHARPRQALDNAHSDSSSVSQSTVGPLQMSGNLTSAGSDVPLDEVHSHIDDPSVYTTTPSLVYGSLKETATRSSNTPTHQRSEPERFRTLFTPQDAVVAHVLGKSAVPSDAPQPSVSAATSDSLPPPPSVQTRSPAAQHGVTLPIHDPFTGVRLSEHMPVSPSALAEMDDRKLWSSLERILDLQAEITVMHADMEGVGGRSAGNVYTAGEGGNVGHGKRSRRGQTLLVGDEEPDEPERRASTGVAVSEFSTDRSDGEDEEVEDEDDNNGHGKKRRDEQFAMLAEQFAQRKVAIGGIMNKLDDLSTVLKAFHALPPPLFDFPTSLSRTDTMSTAPSTSSSPPPPQMYAPSSLPSIALSQTTDSNTPPASFSSPPVPPISTLASLVSGDTSAAPVLPRAALPTIMPGIQYVESPADVGPPHSILQRTT